jgi:hypothetical protein
MMDTSAEIAELAKALSKAQGEFESVPKDANNPFFKSKYADLPAVVKAAAPILAANGLSIVQTLGYFQDDDTLTTRLLHESGQWIEDMMRLYLTKKDSQGMGSATTYARRYSYMAILGLVADDDDDGNSASVSAQPATAKATGTTTKRAAPKAEAKPAVTDDAGPNLAGLFAIKGRDGKSIVPTDDADRHKWAGVILGRDVESFTMLTDEDVTLLKKTAKEQAIASPKQTNEPEYEPGMEPF